MFHQLHCLQSSGWTAHQRVTGHISKGHKPKSSGSGRGAIRQVLTYLRGLLFVLVVYNLFGGSVLYSVEPQRSLGDAAD